MKEFCKDALTGLETKKHLENKYIDYINENVEAYVLNIDFCNFKSLNDEHGHCFGDKCLIAASKQFKINFPNSIIVRKGGDEFIIITNTSKEAIVTKLQKCLDGVKNDKSIFELQEKIAFNCGIVNATENLYHCLKASDIMMYYAKKNENLFQFFDESIYSTYIANETLITEIDDLITNKNIQIDYQKVYTIEDEFSDICILSDKQNNGELLYKEENYDLLRKNYRLKKIDMYNLEQLFANGINNQTIIDINYQTINSKEFDFTQYIKSKNCDNIIFNINVDEYIGNMKAIIDKIRQLEKIGVRISLDNLSHNLVLHNIWCENNIDYVVVKKSNWKSSNKKSIDTLKALIEVITKYKTTPIFTGIETEEEKQIVKTIGQKVLLTGEYYE